MNVRLQHSFNFLAGVHHGTDGVVFNEFDFTVFLITNTTDSVEQNIAFDRITHYIENVVSNGIFIQSTSPEITVLHNAGFKVITLPEVPYDQIIGLALYSKLSAIMEERIFITDVEISSRNGRGITYLHAAEESLGPFELPGWWNDPGLTYFDKKIPVADNKVVKLVKKTESWRDYNLDWEAATDSAIDDGAVVIKFDEKE